MPLDVPPLVGRARLLHEVCRRAQDGVGSVLVGPTGSGGSRLLTEAAAALRRANLAVARLPSVAASAPDHAFLSLLDRPAAARIEAAEPRFRSALLRSAIEDLGLRALTIDDAAAIGDPAAQLLAQLARGGVALIVNASGRRAVPAPVQSLIPEGRLAVTAMPRLSDAEVGALAEHLLLDPVDAELAQALADVSGGRPGTLAEVVHDAVGTRAIVHADGLWHLARPLPAPRSIRSEVRGLLSALPPDQRGWIAAVAVAGRVAVDLAPRIAGPLAASGAEEAGWTILDPATGAVRIATVPARAAVVDSLGVGARVAVLRRLVDALGAVGRPLDDEERVDLLRWRIELGEPVDAQEALALARLPGLPGETEELLLRAAVEGGGTHANAALADHLRRTRRPGEALALIRAALPGAGTPEERARLVRVEAMTTGVVERRSAEALDALDEYLAEFGPQLDLAAVRSGLLLLEGRAREAVDTAEQVVAAPGRSAFAGGFAQLQLALGTRELGLLDPSLAAAARFADDERTEEAFPDGFALSRWLPWETAVAVALDLDAPDAALTELHREAAAQRRATQRPLFAYTLGVVRLLQGDPAGAAQLLRDADGGSGAWRDGWRPRVLAELAIAQTLSGALGDAAGTLDRLARLGRAPVQHGRGELARAQLLAARGDAVGAAATAAAVAERGRATGLRLDAFDGEFAAMRYGDAAAADRLLALGTDPAGIGRNAQRVYAAALRGGDPVELDAAATGLWAVGQRLHAVEAATVAADAGSDDARRRLVAWLARTPDLRLPAKVSGRPIGLTAREREVALLAAAGRSDRDVAVELGISLRTAQTHLARAFAKLGVHRRTDLHGLLDEP